VREILVFECIFVAENSNKLQKKSVEPLDIMFTLGPTAQATLV
jgi:hypothetical protein